MFELAHPRADGTTHLLLEPLELIEKIALLIPPPRFHTLRFHGVLGPHAGWRSAVIPRRHAAIDAGPTAAVPSEGTARGLSRRRVLGSATQGHSVQGSPPARPAWKAELGIGRTSAAPCFSVTLVGFLDVMAPWVQARPRGRESVANSREPVVGYFIIPKGMSRAEDEGRHHA